MYGKMGEGVDRTYGICEGAQPPPRIVVVMVVVVVGYEVDVDGWQSLRCSCKRSATFFVFSPVGLLIQCVEVECLAGLSTWSLISRMCECGRALPPPPIGT